MQSYNVVIIGSGAAGYGTADRLLSFGVKNIAVVTEGRTCGTSRNAGSDKQTYYKLSCTDSDDPMKMASDLSFGGSMHRDTAYVEAANSLRCFLHLVSLGVPFPEDKFGRFVGYKTDHDSASRGTSSGPLTSKYMTECLEKRVLQDKSITLIDNAVVIKIITENGKASGVLTLQKDGGKGKIIPVKAKAVVMATGGEAGIYKNCVFPLSQSGAMGLAAEAGCVFENINEWQYGIASTKVRWNLSGSYQQVIPSYYSMDKEGNRFDFLPDYFGSCHEAYSNVFLKGYQWPFDSRKVNGSSKIDLAVNEQEKLGRKVFIDFRTNPQGYDFNKLSNEAKEYLISAGAAGNTPIERLYKLNRKAIELYKSKGVDLYKEPLQAAVCAQHMNGGAAVDLNWETNIKNLYAVGECAGTFGVYRPGGSALNSTQVGALRAAKNIFEKNISAEAFSSDTIFEKAVQEEKEYINSCLLSSVPQTDYSERISEYSAHSRIFEKTQEIYNDIILQVKKKFYHSDNDSFSSLRKLYKYKDALLSQRIFCATLLKSMTFIGSRGGALCIKDGKELKEDISYREKTVMTDKEKVTFPSVRDFPDTAYNFETVWNEALRKSDKGESYE